MLGPVRVFVAVWPATEIVVGLEAVPRAELPGVRWTTPDQWHVTLQFLGEVADPDEVTAAVERVGAPPATAIIGPESERLGASVLCLPVAGLDVMAARVVAATAEIRRRARRSPGSAGSGEGSAGSGEGSASSGEGSASSGEGRPFRGHLTLARARRGATREVLRRLAPVALSGVWDVEEITVVTSTLGGTGSRYRIIGRIATIQPSLPPWS
jgi:RNA 2',3'-cyclic 3'-phosphodiesterase